MTIQIEKIHHVAYRCKDAKETVEWYKKNLNMDFILAFAEDHVPSTKAFDPYMHLFLDAGNGNVLAFFELPTQPEMGRDENTPKWVQHIALKVKDRQALIDAKEHLEANGIEVLGITNHTPISTLNKLFKLNRRITTFLFITTQTVCDKIFLIKRCDKCHKSLALTF
jgi:catechol 2,3-dioxygenase-like lactoylglutathione lyase family enzyme